NANIGTSVDYPFLDKELKKLEVAIRAGADTVMDLSTGGDLNLIRREILRGSSVPVGTVPVYQASCEAKDNQNPIVGMDVEGIFKAIELHAKDGVDFMTLHCGVNLKALEALINEKRVCDVVSRGGAILTGWMLHNQKENPLYEYFDRVLEIAKKHDVTISLGDGMRPGSLIDASDRAQIQELLTLGELSNICRENQVQVIVEGPGHMPYDQIEANVKLEKLICKGAPFYVLGPLVTDIALGYDHIAAAIGGTLAAISGADFLCYVTPREHLGLPTSEDVKEGVIASRIAAHAADIVKGVPGALKQDIQISKARKALNWKKQFSLALDPEKAEQAYKERKVEGEETCTMCGDFCAMKIISQYLNTELKKCT
ncbi:MAG: phosphomethylpyrimidine synthase ThiC, partial [Candidatus Subteraquimicrobiales bacterium]|nr:phosphomethylpyrimidine synthase ThiC [Candidatus Subteraquimicrobiales bacterium]